MGHPSQAPLLTGPNGGAAGSSSSAGKGLVIKAVMQAYTCVIIWMSISIAVILFNKVGVGGGVLGCGWGAAGC